MHPRLHAVAGADLGPCGRNSLDALYLASMCFSSMLAKLSGVWRPSSISRFIASSTRETTITLRPRFRGGLSADENIATDALIGVVKETAEAASSTPIQGIFPKNGSRGRNPRGFILAKSAPCLTNSLLTGTGNASAPISENPGRRAERPGLPGRRPVRLLTETGSRSALWARRRRKVHSLGRLFMQ